MAENVGSLIPIAEVPRKTYKTCPICGGASTKCGKNKRKFETVQRYRCKVCGTSFKDGGSGYFKGKHSIATVSLAISLYTSGLSMAKVVDKLRSDYDVTVTETTVLEWLRRSNVSSRPQNSGDHRKQKCREFVTLTIPVVVRFASSIKPETFQVLLTEEIILNETF